MSCIAELGESSQTNWDIRACLQCEDHFAQTELSEITNKTSRPGR